VYDAATVRATVARGQNGGSDAGEGIMSAVGAISQQYKSLKQKINGLDILGDKMGLDPGPLANVHDYERKYVGTRKLDVAGSVCGCRLAPVALVGVCLRRVIETDSTQK